MTTSTLDVESGERMSSTKQCSICRELKSTTKFHKNPASRDGLASACKQCRTYAKQRLRAQKKADATPTHDPKKDRQMIEAFLAARREYRFNSTVHYYIVNNAATLLISPDACERSIRECQELIREEFPDITFNPTITIQENT